LFLICFYTLAVLQTICQPKKTPPLSAFDRKEGQRLIIIRDFPDKRAENVLIPHS